MNLMRINPWTSLTDLQREMNRLFEQRVPGETDTSTVATSQWVPSVDIKEDEKEYTIFADIPGVDPKQIEVEMHNGLLTIKGERKSEHEEKEGEKVTRYERSYGYFERRFSLPEDADADQIKAKSRHGVLELQIPKVAQGNKRKKISVEE